MTTEKEPYWPLDFFPPRPRYRNQQEPTPERHLDDLRAALPGSPLSKIRGLRAQLERSLSRLRDRFPESEDLSYSGLMDLGQPLDQIRFLREAIGICDVQIALRGRKKADSVGIPSTEESQNEALGASALTKPKAAAQARERQRDRAKLRRQRMVADRQKVLEELHALEPVMLSPQDYDRLQDQQPYQSYLTFKAVDQVPHLKGKVVSTHERHRLESLADEVVAALYTVRPSTVRHAWSHKAKQQA